MRFVSHFYALVSHFYALSSPIFMRPSFKQKQSLTPYWPETALSEMLPGRQNSRSLEDYGRLENEVSRYYANFLLYLQLNVSTL
jgi:hypothetical protein